MTDINAMSELGHPAIEYVDVCAEDDLWDGEMESFDVGDYEVLVVKVRGQVRAYDGICPHQSASLVEGELTDEGIIVCKAHRWQFDADSGRGVNPASACLRRFPVRVQHGRILVGTERETVKRKE